MRKILTAVALLTFTTRAWSQAADPDIFLVTLARNGGKLAVTGAKNATNRAGYDNQPNWSRDGSTLFFTSVREGEQADIYRMNPATGEATRVTLTAPESEYSATPMPRRNAVSVIRVERDSTQRLWSVPLDGSPSTVILERIKPVGYHTWANDTLLALFVLGSPNTLQLASTTTGRGDTIVTSIGRSLHTREGQVSFVHKASNEEWWLTMLDPKTRQMKRLVRMPPRVEDYSWTPDGLVLIGEGSVLKSFDPRGSGGWEVVGDLASFGVAGITRLSVSPRGDVVAVVAQPSGSGRGSPR